MKAGFKEEIWMNWKQEVPNKKTLTASQQTCRHCITKLTSSFSAPLLQQYWPLRKQNLYFIMYCNHTNKRGSLHWHIQLTLPSVTLLRSQSSQRRSNRRELTTLIHGFLRLTVATKTRTSSPAQRARPCLSNAHPGRGRRRVMTQLLWTKRNAPLLDLNVTLTRKRWTLMELGFQTTGEECIARDCSREKGISASCNESLRDWFHRLLPPPLTSTREVKKASVTLRSFSCFSCFFKLDCEVGSPWLSIHCN